MKTKSDMLPFILGLFLFWVNGDNFAAATLLPGMAKEFETGLTTAAFTVTAYMLCFGLFTAVFGPLGDRFGKSTILKIAAAGSALASLCSAFTPALGTTVAIRALNGIFSAGVMPVSVALVGETSTMENMHSRIAKTMGLMFLGSASATVIGGLVSYWGTWRQVYLVYGIAESLLLAALFIVLPENQPRPSKESFFHPYAEVCQTPGFLKTIGLLFFLGYATLGTFPFLGGYLKGTTDLSLIPIGLILAAYGAGTMFGGRIAGGMKKALGASFFPIAGIVGGAGLIIFRISSSVPALAAAGLLLTGLAFVFLQSSIVASAQGLNPTRRGTVMSTASFTMVTSAALGTLINGKVYAASPGLLLFTAAAAFIIAGLAAGILFSVRKKLKTTVPV